MQRSSPPPGPENGVSVPLANRRRLSPLDRENHIVAEATRYFAEHGFGGGTTELSKRLGVSQALMYRYFPSKEALIERVYETVFPGHWDPRWEKLLEDSSLSVHDRLVGFYKEYADVMLSYEYVRLFLFSGLAGLEYNVRFYRVLTERVFKRIARALREEVAPKDQRMGRISDAELEVAQSLHAMIYHLGLRRWVHTPPLQGDLHAIIDSKVQVFLEGSLDTLRASLEERGRSMARARR